MSNLPRPVFASQTSLPDELRRKQNAIRVSFILTIAYLSAFTLYAYLALEARSWQLYGLNGIMAALLASSISAFGLIHRDRIVTGAFLMIGTIAIGFPLAMILESGLGLTLGMAALMGISLISRLTLKQPYEARALGISVVSAITTILLDYSLAIERPSFPLILTYVPIIATITIGIYVLFIARELPNYNLRTKLILAFILVTLVPLIVLGYFSTTRTRDILYQNSTTDLEESAHLLTLQVDTFVNNELRNLYIESQDHNFVQYLSLTPALRAGSGAENSARKALTVLFRKDPVFIQSYALIDTNGRNILDTAGQNLGLYEKDYEYFKKTVSAGAPIVHGPVFDQQDGHASLFFSAPIRNDNGGFIGILRVEYKASIIQSIVNSTFSLQETDRLIMIVDPETYVRIADTGDIDELYKSFKDFSATEVAEFQAQGRMLPGAPADVIDLTDQFVESVDNLRTTPIFNANSVYLEGIGVGTGAFPKSVPWIVIVSKSQKGLLESINTQTRTTVLISMILIALATLIAYWISWLLTSPVNKLAAVADKIANGDLSARAHITTEDEVGQLAISFNRMTDELNLIMNDLGIRVAERTYELEISRTQSERRASELQIISEISKVITGEQKLSALLPLITHLVSDRFGFYHTGVFLIDESGKYVVLQAASSEGGKTMLAHGHKLEAGENGIIGQVAKFGVPRILLNIGPDTVFFNNPHLPDTRSEMALPLTARGKILGILDLQSAKPGAFTDSDLNTMSILADQIAIAIENARLFQQTQQALTEAESLYRQNIQESWGEFSNNEEAIGYHQTLTSGEKLAKPIDTAEIRQVMNRGSSMVYNASETNQEASIVIPIKLRGQVIGALKINAPEQDRTWTRDEVNLAETISERLSLSIENARLIQESQRHAFKEQTISEVTGKISASINLKNVLQTAVEELGRAMPGSEVIIEFEQKNGKVI
ncbi:MAG: GAF domain-containing protein [Chloroflexota bacterium]|mgnify:CR=1 FL=1